MRTVLTLLAILAPLPALCDTLVASQTIRAKSMLTAADGHLVAGDTPGALDDPAAIVGKEALVTLYAGRPIRPGDIGPPAIVERNQVVPLIYRSAVLNITAEARVLDRAGVGDRVRAMNLDSRTTVFGTVTPDGSIVVSGGFQ
ncbi:flagella basal body P-ring formation protein FlgA [Palleronia aestuarii]|uniref:Flagella basal body P-ring formation protein FlgA n=1 Tax=Palleronia aestuarii TaxID=568105 RepID=A0A2W7NP97_9RHOB|nr:flagellar basal body P-ring formation chaperone FlgA [Palleronia aestuarii]PZX15076.1 flagella basal body P-ring formation protein FlgA [Palleronia aestuarii]